MKKQLINVLVGASLVGIATTSFATASNNATVTGQFMSVSNTPVTAQQNLLAQTFQVRFPISVITVGDAMKYLLQTTGYSLLESKSQYPYAYAMMQRPLPNVDRSFGPLTIKEGLQTLAGPHFQTVIDPVHRIITFRLTPNLQVIYEGAPKQ